jgi:hypothetical protein
MEEKQISEHEGLLLIQQMIQTAKKEQKDDGKGWIIWGWMLFLASILTVMNINFKWFQTFFFWNFFGVITLVALAYQTVSYLFIRKTEKVRTYTKDLFQRLNTGFFISLMFIIVAINVNISPTIGFSLLISLYAFWILIYGSALNFRPSIIAAYITWCIGFVSIIMRSFEQVMLLHAAAVLVGYIIPGHIANNEFRKLHQRNKVVESV